VEIPLVNKIRPRIKDWRGASDTHVYPWGDVALNCSLANFWPVPQACLGDTSSVGSCPAGASPHGALDMAGNVLEWINDRHDDGDYSVSPPETRPARLGGSIEHCGVVP
jgi:formylglycine-generating enzyme required for sulfatase activity